jgi:hypothetical protein
MNDLSNGSRGVGASVRSRTGEESAHGRTDRLIVAAFARIDAVALGCAFGLVAGLVLFTATMALVVKGGDPVGPRLALLAQYLVGYTVTPLGSLVGLAYGAVVGFGAGWLLASLRNFCLALYLHVVRVRSQLSSIHDVLDPE